ncbi:unnamed protein product [Zymoseptoria tritici ST99CH_1E4]|uniref:Uncharacterized protein n=1 Tax=Zymoseptoria tritici ST99CH_1E4 TaxID=1276532 RepID=A0A2H1GQ79_ZYMTR|nr:unnamed protein product [Zymoseptoria tritici ST99CH_1E4]
MPELVKGDITRANKLRRAAIAADGTGAMAAAACSAYKAVYVRIKGRFNSFTGVNGLRLHQGKAEFDQTGPLVLGKREKLLAKEAVKRKRELGKDVPNTPRKRLILAQGSTEDRLRRRVRALSAALDTVHTRAGAKKGSKASVVEGVLRPTEYDLSRDLKPKE